MSETNQNQTGNQENQTGVTFESVKSFFESNKDNQDVQGFLSGLAPKSELNMDVIKKFLNENPEGQSFFDSAKNQHLDTWRKNNETKIIEEELKKRGVVEDETQRQIRELKEQIESSNKKALLAELKVKAKDLAKDKNLPFELIDYFVGGDEENTIKNIETFESVWTASLQKAIEGKIGDFSRSPHKSDKENPDVLTLEQFKKLSYADRVKLKNENPEIYNKLARS